MEEIWKDVVGFEGLYKVSSFGRVYSVGGRIMGRMNNRYKNKPRILKLHERNGYLYASLKKDGKNTREKVHRAVAKAFIPNPNNYPIINHKDENKKNNRVENLEWCTYKYNLNYGSHNTKMIVSKSNNPVAQYDKNNNLVKVWLSSRAVERELGIPHSNIDNCCKERYGYKTAGGFIWKRIKLTKEEKHNMVEK